MSDSENFHISEDRCVTSSRSKLYEIETRNTDFQETKIKTKESFRLDQQIVNRKFQQYLLRTESIKPASSIVTQTNAANSNPEQYASSSSFRKPQTSSQHSESKKSSLSNGHLSANDGSYDSADKQQVQKSEIIDSQTAPVGNCETTTRRSTEHAYEKLSLNNPSLSNKGCSREHAYEKLNLNHPAKSRFGGSRTSMKSVDSESSTVSAGEVLYIPKDGSLRAFSEEQMTTIFRMLHVCDSTVKRLRMKNINGKKFANFTDIDLEQMGMKNPLVCYFRDRSKSSGSKTPIFML